MTDNNAFERFVADHLADDGSGTAQAERLSALINERTSGRRQLPRWLALIKEPPMRTNSRTTVGSPTMRVTAILAATVLLALTLATAGVAGQRLLAASESILVAQDGSGHHTTIQAAVDAADDGDEILVKPGTYSEVVVIDKDITVRGDGSRDEIVIEFGSDGPMVPTWNGAAPYGVMLVDTEAVVSTLTVRGPNVGTAFVFVGGAPTLENIVNELEGDFSGRAHAAVDVLNDAGGTIRNSLLDGPVGDLNGPPVPAFDGIIGTGPFVAENNDTDSGFYVTVTDGSAIVGNTIRDDGMIELELIGSGSVLVEGNETSLVALTGPSDGFMIRDNDVRGNDEAIAGIELGTGESVVDGNRITGVPIGILVPDGASATITANRLEGLRSGIGLLGADAVAVIEDNWFCGNEQDIVRQGSAMALDPSNETCEGEAAE